VITGGLVSVLPSCLLEPLWDEFAALLPEHVGMHPLGCRSPRVPDRAVFGHVIAALVHGSGYGRTASPGCPDRTIRRRVKYWAGLGTAGQVDALALEAYDRMTGLELSELPVDGCITRAPCGGGRTGRSPVDRGRQGLKRPVATDAGGIPIGIVPAGADRHGSPLLVPALQAAREQTGELPEQANVNLDRGYGSARTRTAPAELGFTGETARKSLPAPVQAGKRGAVERSHAWMNGFGKLRRCTEKHGRVIDFYHYPTAAIVTLRMLIRRATPLCRWDDRPTTRRLK
jgi:hypothetical protein